MVWVDRRIIYVTLCLCGLHTKLLKPTTYKTQIREDARGTSLCVHRDARHCLPACACSKLSALLCVSMPREIIHQLCLMKVINIPLVLALGSKA